MPVTLRDLRIGAGGKTRSPFPHSGSHLVEMLMRGSSKLRFHAAYANDDEPPALRTIAAHAIIDEEPMSLSWEGVSHYKALRFCHTSSFLKVCFREKRPNQVEVICSSARQWATTRPGDTQREIHTEIRTEMPIPTAAMSGCRFFVLESDAVMCREPVSRHHHITLVRRESNHVAQR